jgi:pilus assembly protein Flp/PilA
MTNVKKFCVKFWQDESGATAIEYALIAAVVAIGVIAGASAIGKNNDSLWNQVTSAVEDAG